ncbi:MAG: hypothetical protein O2816_03495 [Planctomycetota bacterium]|nr:hypothetical protein [Planctomycetota bacterium]
MLPVLLTLLYGAGLVAGLVLGVGALWRHMRRSQAPTATKLGTAVVGVAGLSVVATVGGVLFVALLATTTLTAFLEHGPVRSIEILRLDGAALASHQPDLDGYERGALASYQEQATGLDPSYPVHVLVEYRGEVRLDRLHRWLERQTDGKVQLVEVGVSEAGLTLLDFGLDLRPDEVTRFEEEFEAAQPFVDLPHGLRLEMREATTD